MTQQEFVLRFRQERDEMLASYALEVPKTYVGKLLRDAQLNDSQREKVAEALEAALTDAFYTVLLGLDGCAAIGGVQQSYRIEDESGAAVCKGDGSLESQAFEAFHQA